MKELFNPAELVKFDQCACFNLRKASRAVTQLFDEVLQPTGLRVTQLSLLVGISIAGSIPITQLAERLVMDRTTLARNLKPLEKQGLIKIALGVDRRTRVVEITERGRKALMRAIPLWEKAQAHIVKGLGEGPWQDLLARLSATVEVALSRKTQPSKG